MTPGLSAFAATWARNYVGTFSFMLDMRANAGRPRGLSAGMAKGVLNCYRADMDRRPAPAPAAPAPRPTAPATADGYRPATADDGGTFRITPDGAIVKITVSRAGRVYGKIRSTVGGTGWDYAPAVLRGGIRDIGPDDAAAAGEWGHHSDRCVFCATPLEDDGPGGSMDRGYGPTCAGHHGLPHGPGK